MKFIIMFIVLLFPFVTSEAEEQISVKITSIDINRGGNLMIIVFGEEGFPIQHKDALVTQTIMASKETIVVTLPAPKNNNLAFKVLHDEGSNNKVTKN